MTNAPLTVITAENFDALTFDSSIPVLVFFGKENCQVCKEVLPAVEQIAGDLAQKMNFYSVDAVEHKTLTTRFRLKGVPQILIFSNGEIRERIGGLAEKEAIMEKINSVFHE